MFLNRMTTTSLFIIKACNICYTLARTGFAAHVKYAIIDVGMKDFEVTLFPELIFVSICSHAVVVKTLLMSVNT